MKKIILFLLFIVFFKALFNHYKYNNLVSAPIYSIAVAKEWNSFVAAYNIVYMEKSVEDTLKKLNYSLHSLDFCVSRPINIKNKYLLFHTYVYENSNVLVFKGLFHKDCSLSKASIDSLMKGEKADIIISPCISGDTSRIIEEYGGWLHERPARLAVAPARRLGPVLALRPCLAAAPSPADPPVLLFAGSTRGRLEVAMTRWGRSAAQGGGAATRERSDADPAFSWPARHIGCLDASAAVRLPPVVVAPLKSLYFFTPLMKNLHQYRSSK